MESTNTAHLVNTNVAQVALGATAVATLGVLVLVARDQSVVDAVHAAAPPVRDLLSAIAESWYRNGGARAIVLRN